MVKTINFHCFYFSTYLIIILISFIISFIIFYKMLKKKYDKVEIAYIFAINILGFAIGSKLFHLIDSSKAITISNFINSGYSFIGGLLGSALLVSLYCKRYKINFADMEAHFMIIYPLIYAISKLACFVNGCCNCIIQHFPLQILESILMFILFAYLYNFHKRKQNCLLMGVFLMLFGTIRFVIDYFRYTRNEILLNLTLSQVVCIIAIVLGLYIINKKHGIKCQSLTELK